MSDFSRREFQQSLVAGFAAAALPFPRDVRSSRRESGWEPKYLLASSLYGETPLAEILPEVKASGAEALDIWARPHGNQREQLEAMGEASFQEQLTQQQVKLGCITQFPLGPFGLQDEMRLAQRLGCQTIVTGSPGGRDLTGSSLKSAIAKFAEQLQPHLAVAQETGVRIAIENHANSLINSPDSIRWLIDACTDPHLAIALAPYHLPQDPALIAELVESLGERMALFYAWQYGEGCMTKLPKDKELLQMPGRGPLDFEPICQALRAIQYQGWIEVFMHPVPRGIPILESTKQVTGEINRARKYLDPLFQ